MKKAISLLVYIFALIAFMNFTVISCSGAEDENTVTIPSDGDDDGGDGGGSPIDDIPVDTVETTGFWVNIISDQFTVLIGKRGQYNSDCFIAADTTSNERIVCDVDLMEGDLNIYDIEMQYNVPPSLCDHVRVSPAWHYNYESGVGPSRVEIVQNNLADPPVASACDAFHTANNALDTCVNHPETVDETAINGPTCIYDRSEAGGKNCCFGDYVLETELDDDANGVGDGVFTEQNLSWGGDPKACASPYLSNGWEHFTDAGFPTGFRTPVPKDPDSQNPIGLNSSISMQSNLATSKVGVSTWANFFEDNISTPHTHNGFWYNGADLTNITSDRPYWVDPIDDLDGSLMSADNRRASALPAGNEAWEFSCLDAGYEVKHQIHVYIREWNTLVDYVAYQTSEGVTYNPDVGGLTGTEGGTCNYDPAFPEELCNDLWDFSDLMEVIELRTTNRYPSTNRGTVNDQDRELYFPNVDYD